MIPIAASSAVPLAEGICHRFLCGSGMQAAKTCWFGRYTAHWRALESESNMKQGMLKCGARKQCFTPEHPRLSTYPRIPVPELIS